MTHSEAEHHETLIIGGGPAGLPLLVVLAGGVWPRYRRCPRLEAAAPDLARRLAALPGPLTELDLEQVARVVRPVDLFNLLHRPENGPSPPERMGMDFIQGARHDALLLTRGNVGGLWNDVPRRLLTLSPAHWMEFAFHPLTVWARENGRDLDPEALIIKQDLIDYYHSIPERFGVSDAVVTNCDVERIEPDPAGFRVTTSRDGRPRCFTSRRLVYAGGQRSRLRRLGIPGEDLPIVSQRYDSPESFLGDRVLVVGGGRSADWAATELFDAGRSVHYVMRQPAANHYRLVSDSLNLPYYARLAEIHRSGSPRWRVSFETHLRAVESDGTLTLENLSGRWTESADRVLLEIGGDVDYSLFHGFPPFTLVEKRDRYRYQCHQLAVHPHNHESVDAPNLYAGGYLASGIKNVVVAMHGATYVIAADILQRHRASEHR